VTFRIVAKCLNYYATAWKKTFVHFLFVLRVKNEFVVTAAKPRAQMALKDKRTPSRRSTGREDALQMSEWLATPHLRSVIFTLCIYLFSVFDQRSLLTSSGDESELKGWKINLCYPKLASHAFNAYNWIMLFLRNVLIIFCMRFIITSFLPNISCISDMQQRHRSRFLQEYKTSYTPEDGHVGRNM
jgi:hypothetical protein